MIGNGIRAKYLMYPIPTNTPAGCTGNRQSRSIGEDGDTGSDVTPRVLLYMDIISLFVRFVMHECPIFSICKEGVIISPPHAIWFCCYGGRRYGRRRVREKRKRKYFTSHRSNPGLRNKEES